MSCLPSGQGWRQPAGAEGQLRSLPKVKPKSHSGRQKCSKQLGAAETYCDNMAHGAVAKHVNCGEACIEQESGWLGGTILGRHSATVCRALTAASPTSWVACAADAVCVPAVHQAEA